MRRRGKSRARGARFGDAADVHAEKAKGYLRGAVRALNDAERARDCTKVIDGAIAAQANASAAHAHIESARLSVDYSNHHQGIQARIDDLRRSLVFQCTRRRERGGVG